MTNDLVPTLIVDKNGKTTTVRKKPETGRSASLRVANVPPVLPSANAPTRLSATPLPSFGSITESELEHLADQHPAYTYYGRNSACALEILQKCAPPETWALVKRFHDGGGNPQFVEQQVHLFQRRLTDWDGQRNGASYALLHLNSALLVADRIHRDFPDVEHWDPESQSRFVDHSLTGYIKEPAQSDCLRLKPFSTVEELDRITAHTAFVLNAEKHHGGLMGRSIENTMYPDAEGISRFGTIIPNRGVAQYLRQHPNEIRRVMRYMENNEYDNTEETAQNLVQFLDETAEVPALDDGWL